MTEESTYTFKLCSSANDLREAYRLRLEVFHVEQGFPEDTEVDQYDPISAHFILISKADDKVVATVRLTPYPRYNSTHQHDPTSQTTVTQNETAIATSGGGGENGTAGALPMTSSSDGPPSASADKPLPKSDMMYHAGLPNPDPSTEESVALSDANFERKFNESHHGYPLGGPQSESSMAHEFLRKLKSAEPFREVEGAPNARGSKLSRLAVSKSMRGKKLGALTVKKAEAWLIRILSEGGGSRQGAMGQGGEKMGKGEDEGSFTIIISSQMHAKGFYELLGYSVYGEPYDEEGAPHTWCTKRIKYE
ncbi:hypothetical protein CBS101457_000773 [Exobasidium rhododendri]|nr:hypothetical protein CBS101457_000773 [Exobasidium rhododendri]